MPTATLTPTGTRTRAQSPACSCATADAPDAMADAGPNAGADAMADAALPALKALADPVRLRIVLHIAASPSTVCACSMNESFGVSQPTLSHHLKRLVDAGLLHREMRGSWAHFSLRPEGFAALAGVLDAATRHALQEDCHEC